MFLWIWAKFLWISANDIEKASIWLIFACIVFTDPEVVEDVSVEMLREGKSYQKVLLKQEKELDALRKKHDKVSNSAQNNGKPSYEQNIYLYTCR